VEDWVVELQQGRSDAAWDAFVGRYRRVIFAAIRHYAQDYDDVMDIFARVCEALREDDLRRLRSWAEQAQHRARFTTWLVTVVRHLTVDWFRQRDGRRRLPALVEGLAPLQRRIFESVFLDQRSHLETYELIRSRDAPELTFRQFLTELRNVYAAATKGRSGRLPLELAAPVPDADDQPDGAEPEMTLERGDALGRALATLSAEDRVAVQMFVIDEVPADRVARVLGLTNAKAVYNRVYRALDQLRQHLRNAGIRRGDL